ncbi:MAG: hypothetical protein LBQ52_10300 [Helicobacteraceae bacterium]|nr:hypothetical protein [Helicobacteraceae bacterium]
MKHKIIFDLEQKLKLIGEYCDKDSLLVLYAPNMFPFSYWYGWDFIQHYFAFNQYVACYFLPCLYYRATHSYFNLLSTYRRALQVGDYMEFGGYVGSTMSAAYYSLKNVIRNFYAFDSFCGLIGTQENEKEIFGDGQYSCNEKSYYHNLAFADVDTSRIHSVAGDFLALNENAKSIKEKNGMEYCAIAHIDCDIFLPAYECLKFLEPLLKQGSFLLMDDYNAMYCDNNAGLRKALRLFSAKYPAFQFELHQFYGPHQASFIVHKIAKKYFFRR